MSTEFQQIEDFENRPDDTEFSWESEYDGLVDSEGNPDPENRDDQDFSWESTVEEPTTVITKRGANYEVADTLNAITFIPGTACAMSEAIAYIRYWSRKGTGQKQPVSQEPQNDKPTDEQKALQDEINQKYLNSVDESFANPTFGTEEITGSETRVIAKVPENTAYQSRPRQPVPTRVSVPATVPQPVSGKTYSANPSGTLATTPFVIPAEAVWTFLFNPEELQLSSGPDFNRAETWGVSDPVNSGQPLSWRSNKNRKLTFGKVLLHGYSFGKRVDSLERGLQELFTARDGENGADGPPVLEFVWGKRVFGPCVIQNIQVREKAWDNGLLVNAEVSFELEQVPEWTINDGFVDVLRPGRQSTVNDPLVPASTVEAGADPGDVEGKENDDKKTPDGGKPPSNQYDPNLCQFASTSASNFYALASDTDRWLRGRIDPILPPGQRYIDEVRDISEKFNIIRFNFYTASSLIGKYVDDKMRTYAPGCASGGVYNKGGWNSEAEKVVGDLFKSGKYKSGVGFINACVKNIEKHIKEWQADPKNLKCQPEREQAAKLAEIAKCQQFQLGRKCDALGSQITCSSANGGKTVFCRRNTNKQGPSFIWSNK